MNRRFSKTLVLILFIGTIGWQAEHPEKIPIGASVDHWQDILSPTEECQLPCWWGITPSETSSQEAQERIMILLGEERVYSRTNEDGIWVAWAEFPDELNPYQRIIENTQTGTIEEIYQPFFWNGEGEGVVSGMSFGFNDGLADVLEGWAGVVWRYFEPANLITLYGKPDFILTDLHQLEDGEGLYGTVLNLYWEQLDMVAGYDILFSYQPDYAARESVIGEVICFDQYTLTGLQIDVYSPAESMEKLYQGKINDLDAYAPLSERVAMTIEQFSQILVEHDNCLPANLPAKPRF